LISKKLNKEKRQEENSQIIESTNLEAQNSSPSSTNNSNWYFGNASTVARGKDIFQKRCSLASILYREIHGYWPANCRIMPTLQGMLQPLNFSV
jgi:hypothetical protein